MIHQRVQPEIRGRLLTVETQDDRTLFFDLLPLFFKTAAGYRVKVKLFTVPGQIIHNATRRVVLQGADAVAFVADSQRSATADNNAYWKNLHDDMRENGLDPDQVPVVIQFNKRDLPNTKDDAEIEETRRRGREPVIAAVAVRCEGVLETLFAVLQLAFHQLDARSQLSKHFGLDEKTFLSQIFSRIDLRGSQLEHKLSANRGQATGSSPEESA